MIHVFKANSSDYLNVLINRQKHLLIKGNGLNKVNDLIILKEFENHKYSGNEIILKILEITKNCHNLGLNVGYHLLTIQKHNIYSNDSERKALAALASSIN